MASLERVALASAAAVTVGMVGAGAAAYSLAPAATRAWWAWLRSVYAADLPIYVSVRAVELG